MKETDKALCLFSNGYSCAQAALAPFAKRFGIPEPTLLKISAPFGGGVARTGHICGAASGALMALGLAHGSAETSPEIKEGMYGIGKTLMERFIAKHGSLMCRDIIGCDLSTPEGRQQAKERRTHETICTDLVRFTVVETLKLMEDSSLSHVNPRG